MTNFLSRFLQKRGIKSADELSPDERQTFNNWKRILDGEELTVGKITEFCQQQVEIIEGKWRSFEDEEKKGKLIPYHTVYKVLLQAISAPAVERKNLENYLNQLLQ